MKNSPFGLPPGTIRDAVFIIFSLTVCISFLIGITKLWFVDKELSKEIIMIFSMTYGTICGYYFGTRKDKDDKKDEGDLK